MAHGSLSKTLRQAQGSQVLMVVASMGAVHSTALSDAIAEMIHVNGLSERLAESPRLARGIKLSKMVSLGYTANNKTRIEANAEFEGLPAMADGLTNQHTPLANVLIGKPGGAILSKIVDCSGHCATGGTKDALFPVNEIWSVMEETWGRCYDQNPSLIFTPQTWS